MGAPLAFSLLFLLVGSAQAYVYSCEELLNKDIEISSRFVCVILQEGYEAADVILGNINVQLRDPNEVRSLASIAEYRCGSNGGVKGAWQIVADPSVDLDCTQEFTLIFMSNRPDLLFRTENIAQTFAFTGELALVSPRTGISLHKLHCNDVGNITVYTGAGNGVEEERFPMQTWRCSDFPDRIVAFDNVITLETEYDANSNGLVVEWTTHDPKHAIEITDYSRLAVMSSGLSDDLQNTKGRNEAWFSFGLPVCLVATGPCFFDARYRGEINVAVQHADYWYINWCDTETARFDGGESFEAGQTIEVIYFSDSIAPSDLWNNQDNFVFDIALSDPSIIYTSPQAPTVEGGMSSESRCNNRKSLPDPYCSCALDNKFGMPEDWNSTDIWIDVIVILDTSEAMGDVALIDASTLIESFIGTDDDDVLTTDTTANFYTRVGLIAMADKAEVLYNLNMTKADKVVGKAQIKKGLTQINVVDAFNAAMNMFADGLKDMPERVNTRQVIYYMTNSDPKTDLTSMNQFKTSYGIIIVNNFVESGVTERPGLRNLASDGYYYTDIQYNYMETIQLFCKANCFCRPDLNRTPYAGNNEDPAVKASGGCLRAVPAGVQYSKARMNCDSEGGGLIASIHDGNKADFVNQLMKKALPSSSDYYWIGYSKTDAGWSWEDQSRNPYTNWDVANGEPSSSSVAKCAYVDKTTKELLWGAGNCNVGFPFACEFAPCAVGNKNC